MVDMESDIPFLAPNLLGAGEREVGRFLNLSGFRGKTGSRSSSHRVFLGPRDSGCGNTDL